MSSQRILGAVAFAYGTIEVSDPDATAAAEDVVDVPALFLGERMVWHAKPGVYWDEWGAPGEAIVVLIADALRETLMDELRQLRAPL
jgi:hypothetical protein